jgi:hypothetical protein
MGPNQSISVILEIPASYWLQHGSMAQRFLLRSELSPPGPARHWRAPGCGREKVTGVKTRTVIILVLSLAGSGPQSCVSI